MIDVGFVSLENRGEWKALSAILDHFSLSLLWWEKKEKAKREVVIKNSLNLKLILTDNFNNFIIAQRL